MKEAKVKKIFNHNPSTIVFDFDAPSGNSTASDEIICDTNGRFRKHAVIEFEADHFTTKVFAGSKIWRYDGMKDGGKLVQSERIKKRALCLAVYVKSNVNSSDCGKK